MPCLVGEEVLHGEHPRRMVMRLGYSTFSAYLRQLTRQLHGQPASSVPTHQTIVESFTVQPVLVRFWLPKQDTVTASVAE